MNNNPVYWKGQELPPKKSGHVYVIRMWPGGRMVLDQVWFHEAHYADDAVKRLTSGHPALVWLDDVDFVIASLPDNHPVKRKVKG